MSIGVYVHIPFCRRKCPYCDFYSLPLEEERANAYVEAVLRAVRSHPFGERTADTLYFGGGTPSILGEKRLERLVSACVDAFRMDPASAEITMEANPASSLSLSGFKAAGLNRISFGVQSLSAGELRGLGRIHSPEDALNAIVRAEHAGFDNISADLMLGISGQTAASLENTLARLTALPVRHISAYLLKIEDDTPFGKRGDSLRLPDENAVAELYLQCVESLEHRGFRQYEISNFAKNGAVSRHNLGYWLGKDYLGIGPAAHSLMDGRRFFFPRNLDEFLRAEEPFSLAVADGDGGGAEERSMLRLRLTAGLDAEDSGLTPEGQALLLSKARELERHGLVRVSGENVALTPQGFLLSTPVTAALLYDSGALDSGG